jgi:hypothetical protein
LRLNFFGVLHSKFINKYGFARRKRIHQGIIKPQDAKPSVSKTLAGISKTPLQPYPYYRLESR